MMKAISILSIGALALQSEETEHDRHPARHD